MKKSELKTVPEYFDRYINLVEDIDLFEAFNKSIEELKNLDFNLFKKIGFKTYTLNKWTINEIIQHIADIERLLISGTLRFVRGDENFIISFDEENIAKNSKANEKDLRQIVNELISVRRSTIKLFETFDEEDFHKSGINWKYRISIEAMGFNIIGHQIHHINFIKDNYYQLG
ncbi:DinB superfamily protein [compost metagenome]